MSDDKQLSIVDAIEAAREKFIQVAPRGIDFLAESAFAGQILNGNDYLKSVAVANPVSLQNAVLNVAAIGLSLNPAKKQAYLIPRSVKKGDKWIPKVFLEPSYMGLCDLATMSGSIQWVQANVVRAGDKFMDNGPGKEPLHQYNPFAKPEDRGNIVGAYCVAKTAQGDYLTTCMALDELEDIRGRSEQWKKSQSGPWKTDFSEQCKKTVVRRAFKMWPKTESLDRMALAVQLSNENEGFEPLLSTPAIPQATVDQKQYFDQLLTDSDAIGLFLFSTSIDETVWTSLYHSFPKGEKGRYQKLVRELQDAGRSKLEDMRAGIMDAVTEGHDGVIAEILDGLADDAIEWLKDQSDGETVQAMNTILKELAA